MENKKLAEIIANSQLSKSEAKTLLSKLYLQTGTRECAKLLNISVQTLFNWINKLEINKKGQGNKTAKGRKSKLNICEKN